MSFIGIPANFPSLCIPRAHHTISRENVLDVLEKFELGKFYRVDMVHRMNQRGEKFQRVFIHFKAWYDNEYANKIRLLVLEGKDFKVIYNNPWFWKIYANKSVVEPFYKKREERRQYEDYPRQQQYQMQRSSPPYPMSLHPPPSSPTVPVPVETIHPVVFPQSPDHSPPPMEESGWCCSNEEDTNPTPTPTNYYDIDNPVDEIPKFDYGEISSTAFKKRNRRVIKSTTTTTTTTTLV